MTSNASGPSEAPETPRSTATSALAAVVESILFVSPEPVPIERLRSVLECDAAALEAALRCLAADLTKRGVRLQRDREGIQLVTAPEHAARVERFLGIQASARPSPAALETLAIVAYRQPIGRPQIEEIRGVNSDRAIRSLIVQGLIQEVGRGAGLGRPVLYGTTPEFLQRFGLESLEDLPRLEDGE